MVRLGALLRRSRNKAEEPEAQAPVRPTIDTPPLVVMIPDVAGVSSFRLSRFTDAQAASRFILTLSKPQRERAHAFWALQTEPADPLETEDTGGEAMVLIRSAEGSDLVYVVSFVDIESAQSFARFEVKRGMHLGLILIYWASMVSLVLNDDKVQLIPERPPHVASRFKPLQAGDGRGYRISREEIRGTGVDTQVHDRLAIDEATDEAAEQWQSEAEAAERARLEAEAEEQRRLEAEAAERARLEAEAEDRRLQAEAEERRLAAQAAERARLEAEAEDRMLQAEAEERRLAAQAAERARLQAEAEQQRRLAAEAAERARLQAEADEQGRLEAEAEEQRRFVTEAAERARLQAEAEEQRRLEAEAEEQRRFAAEAEERARLQAEAEEQGRLEAEADEQRRLAAEAEERAQLEAEAEERRRLEEEAESWRLEAEAEERARLEAEAEEQRRVDAEAEQRALSEAIETERRRLEAEAAERFEAAKRAILAQEEGNAGEEEAPSGEEAVAGSIADSSLEPNPIEELLRKEAESRVQVPRAFAKEPPGDEEPDSLNGLEHDINPADIADEVGKILRRRRWAKRESPFEGFKSPPGRF